MTAVILAAGTGSRLGTSSPKCLVRVGGRTLIERSLEAIRRAGIRDAVVVNGFAAGQIEQALRTGRGSGWPSIRLIHNPDFGSTGSMQSLLSARHALSDDILVLESDLLYEERALAAILSQGKENSILVSDPLGSGDDVYVHADGAGTLRDLGKAAPPDGAMGALVGISRLSRSFTEHLFHHADRERAEGGRKRHYEETILAASRDGLPVHCVSAPGLAWIEIDTPADLARARHTVWPEIRRRSNGVR